MLLKAGAMWDVWVLERRYEEPSYLPSSEVDFSDLGV